MTCHDINVDVFNVYYVGYGLPILGDYEGHAWIRYYDGSQTAADPMLLARYGTHPDRPWTADMVGTGLCYAILTFYYDREAMAQVEDQMCRMTARGYEGRGSPDRVDALVWALTALMVEPAQRQASPQVRRL
ncbi:hypothetical protein IQ03_04170 [Gemmobacter caeni]|uniref:Uncharacterized protein n=1 Tax=Gemmobacter caeni TaxID=589035 RepID=A0A2T6AQ56_9RHOB|nr:hypothetical protein C8N34_1194 [Gemmobacter caeni]TWI94244.1 hypothetical protein IQ03_04170 [Gemmobacter caeni]